jgi:DNA-binding transcriptional ArsR family regulator
MIPKGIIWRNAVIASVAAFKALGDPTRQQILSLLAEQDMTIGEVVDHFDMTRAGVKKHMKFLEAGRLITVKPNGRERINSLNKEGFAAVSQWIAYFDQFWDEKLDALQALVEKEENK